MRNVNDRLELRVECLAHRVEPPLDITTKENPQALADALEGILLPTGTVRVTGKGDKVAKGSAVVVLQGAGAPAAAAAAAPTSAPASARP